VILVAAGQQRYIMISPLAEGLSNLLASVVLGLLYGGMGVALGTLLGSFVSVGAHLLYSMPRTNAAITFSRKSFLGSGLLYPCLCTSPLLGVAIASMTGVDCSAPVVIAASLTSIFAALLLVRQARKGHERQTSGLDLAQEEISVRDVSV
jgi:O-antigen/teichoic acid export membrane protein